MVEKWLLQVQEVMIVSLKDVMEQAVGAYEDESRVQWVVQWPGQVVLAGTSIYWTRDVAAAIRNGTLKVCPGIKEWDMGNRGWGMGYGSVTYHNSMISRIMLSRGS